MNDALAVTQRPTNFDQLVGQSTITEAVNKLKSRRVWLIVGPSGSGKTTLARIMALSYQQDLKHFGFPTEKTLGLSQDFAIHEVNGARYTGKEAMDELVDMAEYVPDEPTRQRCIILDEAHKTSAAAQDSLLKPLEDVPNHVRWFICTNKPDKLKPEIQRRCVKVVMNGLDDGDRKQIVLSLKKATGHEGKVQPFIDYANKLGVSSAGMLTAAFEQWHGGMALNKAFIEMDQVAAFDVCRAAIRGDWTVARSLLATMTPETIKELRYIFVGYLKNQLLKSQTPAQVARALEIMCPVVAYEDTVAAAEISGRVYTLCQIFGRSR